MNLQQIILKLQFLDDSKAVILPIHSSLMPSPKVHTQIPSQTPAFDFTDSYCHWVVLRGQISLKGPLCGRKVAG